MITLNNEIPHIYPFWAIQIRLFKANKMFIINFAKYFDYTDVFLFILTTKY